MSSKPPVDMQQLSARMTEGVERGDLAAVDKLLSPDFKAWHNFSPTFKPWAEVRQNLSVMRPNLDSMNYENVRVTVLKDGWLQQHLLRMKLKDGSEREVYAAIIFKVNDQGLVSSLEEYLDPGKLPGH